MKTFIDFIKESDDHRQNWHTRHPKEPKHHKSPTLDIEHKLSVAHREELKKRGLSGSQGPFSQDYDGRRHIEKTYLDNGKEFHSYASLDGKIEHKLHEAQIEEDASANSISGGAIATKELPLSKKGQQARKNNVKK